MPSVTSAGNLEKYKEILDENLLQLAQDLRLGRRFTFPQDTAPNYTVEPMLQWLQNKAPQCP